MNRRRTLLGLAGATALLVAVGGVASLLSVQPAVDALGNDYLFLAVIAGVGLLVAFPAFVSGRASNVEQATVPTPETPATVPPAGRTFDETVGSWRFRLPVYGREQRRAVRDRLRAAAVGAVMRERNCSRDVARRRVAAGEWTDDPGVAAYLGGGADVDDPPRAGIDDRLGALLSGGTWHERQARRAADRLADRGTP
jgi:hypothetical protein